MISIKHNFIFIPIFFIASSLKGKSEATDTLRIKNLSKKYYEDCHKLLDSLSLENYKFYKLFFFQQRCPRAVVAAHATILAAQQLLRHLAVGIAEGRPRFWWSFLPCISGRRFVKK